MRISAATASFDCRSRVCKSKDPQDEGSTSLASRLLIWAAYSRAPHDLGFIGLEILTLAAWVMLKWMECLGERMNTPLEDYKLDAKGHDVAKMSLT